MGLTFALGAGAFAQVTNYTFSVGSDPYADLAGATTFTVNGGGGTADDGYSALQPIGFSFSFGGTSFTDFSMHSNGWIRLGALASTTDYSVMDNATMNNVIAFNSRDLNNTGAVYSYLLDGSPGSYICKIEAKNFYRYNNASHLGNAQVWLYEATGVIEVRYGSYATTWSSGTAQVGIRTTNTDVRKVVSATWAGVTGSSTDGVSNTAGITQATTNQVVSGTLFTFTPPVVCSGTPDPGSITTPQSACSGNTIVLTATGLTTGTNISYQWEESPDGVGSWADVVGGSGATTASYTTTAITGTRYFRIKTTCSTGPDENFSNVVTVNAISPSYATYDGTLYAQGFESWSNLCNTTDVPSANWKNDPATGNNSWRRNDQGTSAAWTSVSGAYSPVFTQGSYSARFHSFNASSGTKGNLDLYIDMTAGSANDDLLFDYINTSGGDSLTILQSTDGGATFTRLGTILTTAGAWTLVERKVTSTSATTVIRLRATSDIGATDIGVDNFRIMPPPTCLVPTGLTLVPTMTSLSASWTAEPNAAGYDWEVRDAGDNMVESNSTAGTSFSTSVALTPNTTYSVYLRSDCSGDGTSTWVGPVSVYTGYCVPTRTNSGDYISSFSTTDGITNITNNGSANAAYSDHTNMSVTASANTTFNYSVTYVGGSNGVRVWVDWDNNLQFDAGELMSTAANGASPRTGSVTVPNGTPSGSYRMRVRAAWNVVPTSACGNESYGEAEDYTLTVSPPPTCEAPTGAGASNVTTTSADIAWTCTSCTGEFIVEYGAPGFTPGTDGSAGVGGTIWTGSPVAGSPVTITGLTANTAYQVYVREVCPGDDHSPNSSMVSFTTACGAMSVPFTQDFNSVTTPNLPNCWSKEDINGGTPTASTWATAAKSTNGFSGNVARYLYSSSLVGNDWLYTPGLALTGGTSYRVRYKYAAESATWAEQMDVYWGTAADAGAMTNLIVDHGSFNFIAAAQAEYDFTPPSTGTYYIGWHAYSTADKFYINLDDIEVFETPACPIPSGVSVSGTTHTGTNVNFTCSGCTGSIIVEYGETGFTPGTDENPGVGGTVITGATSPQAISGLSASTAYQVYVRQDCSANGDGFSDNTAVVAFTTQAPPPECPGSLGANSVTIGSLPYSTTGQSTCGSGNNVTAANVIVACGSTSYYGAEDRTYTFTAPVTGVYNILLTTGTDQDAGIMLYQGCPFTSGSTCVGNAQSTTGLTRTLTPTLTMGETYYLVVDNFPSPACITTYSLAIDPPAACPAPTGVAVSGTTYNSTNVSFTCTGCTGTYEIDYGPNPHTAGTGTIVPGITASPYLLSPPLSPSTGYQIFVRQDCSVAENGFSAWSSAVNFTTPVQPPVNELCANALPLACNSTVSGTTVGASGAGAPTANCNDAVNDPYVWHSGVGGVWYTVAGFDGTMRASTCGSSFDTQVWVGTTSDCVTLTCVAGNDDAGSALCASSSTRSVATWTGSSSQTYYVYVTGWSTTGNYTLTMTCGDTNPSCTANGLNLEFQNDANASQVTWEILNAGNVVVLSGANPIPNNQIGTQALCLPDGCYRLRVLDSGGDGMTTGGYELRTTGNERIIDNTNNFSTGSVSAIAGNQGFCLPIGTDKLIFSSCDKLEWVNNKFIVVAENPAVSAQFGVSNANSGYEFWFYEPNGGYSFRRFRSHSTSDGYGSGALRANHFKVNGWTNSGATPHIPANTLLNVRVRGRVNGSNLPFGPACLFKIDATLAACPRVKLQDDPANVGDFSCGVVRTFGGSSNPNNRITANPPQPVPTVASANVRYQFRFRIAGEGICIVRPPQTSARLVLNWTNGPALQSGKTYDVDVRVSLNGGSTWCFGPTGSSQAAACADTEDWGKVCLVTIGGGMQNGGNNSMAVEGTNANLTMFPNPNRGDQLFVSLSSVENGVSTVSVDIFDLTGKKVTARTIAVNDGFVNTALDLNGELASGMYLVNVTAGSKAYTERLVIQH